MVDYPYVECTSAVIQSLRHFTEQYPDYRRDDIRLVSIGGPANCTMI